MDEFYRILFAVESSMLRMERGWRSGDAFTLFIRTPDRSLYQLHWNKLLETGLPQICDLRMLRKDGTPFWAQVGMSPGLDVGGLQAAHIVISDLSERKSVEQALIESETRFREVLENSLDASYKRDLKTDSYEYMSPVFARISGYTPDEMKNLPTETVLSLIHPGDLAEIERVLAEAMSGAAGTAYQMEYRFKHKDGRYRWFHDRFIVLLDANDQPLTRIGSVSDISDRKQVELAFSESEKRYRALFNQAGVGVALLETKTGRVVEINPGLCDFLGYSNQELLGMNFRTITHPDDIQDSEDWLALLRERKIENFSMEKRYLRKDKRLVWGHVTVTPLCDKGSETTVLYHISVVEDITERKQIEEQIRQLNLELEQRVVERTADLATAYQFSQEIITIAGEGVFALDWNFHVTVWNPILEQMTGVSADEALNKTARELFPHVWEQGREAIFKRVLDGETVVSPDRPFHINPTGKLGWFSSIYAPRHDGTGKVIGLIGIVRDISDRKQAEVDLENQATQSETLVEKLRKLTQALIETQETERRNLALELHDQLGQMLSSTKILLDMIPNLPEEQAGNNIQKASNQIGELIIRARRVALDLRPTMLDDLGLLPALNWLFKNYKIQTGETVVFDHAGLDQRFLPKTEIIVYRIIQEALTNIMRHAGNKQVYVSARADDQAIHLRIKDNGVGFAPESLLANNEASGLSGMRERAYLLGGELIIKSSPGAGTELTTVLHLEPPKKNLARKGKT